MADPAVERVYDAIRAAIVRGDAAPGARLHQDELAASLHVSRTPVREALRRLAGEGLVESRSNRGFYAADFGLDAVYRRLEVRTLLEPEIARVAAARRTPGDLAVMEASIAAEREAGTSEAVHDASRAFHVALAVATRNDELVRVLESLWIADIGRHLLAERRAMPQWQRSDADEHAAILGAVAQRDGEAAARLMRDHVGEALRHWSGGHARATNREVA